MTRVAAPETGAAVHGAECVWNPDNYGAAMLRMKSTCERCSASLGLTDRAFICSFENTFCSRCAEQLGHSCPSCQAELVQRPARTRSPTEVPDQRFKAKLEKLLT